MNGLTFFLEHMYAITGIPVRCMSSNETLLLSLGFANGSNPFETDPALLRRLTGSKNNSHPVVEYEDGIIIYGVSYSADDSFVVLGPVALNKPDPYRTSAFAARHQLVGETHIETVTFSRFVATLSAVFFVHSGKTATSDDIIHGNTLSGQDTPADVSAQSYMMDNSEREIERFSYADEQYFMQQVRDGDVDAVRALDNQSKPSSNRGLLDERTGRSAIDTFKHYEYMTCAGITLFCRAAIEGGLDPMSAYALSDILHQRLGRCTTISEILTLIKESRIEFTEQVRRIRQSRSRSSYVEKAKNYINNHLNKPLTLNDIAVAAGVSRPYLSQQFTKETGISVMDYVRNKRIEAAANMLRYSDEDISTVANYLCFHSQSHFGMQFKKVMGTTPHKYREQNRLVDVGPSQF